MALAVAWILLWPLCYHRDRSSAKIGKMKNSLAKQIEAAYNSFARVLNELTPEMMKESPEIAEEIYDCMRHIYGLIGALKEADKDSEEDKCQSG